MAAWLAGAAGSVDGDKRKEQCRVERQHPHVNEPWVDVPDEQAVLHMEAHQRCNEPEPEASREGEPDQQRGRATGAVRGQPPPLGRVFPDAISIYRLWNRIAHSASPYSATAISRAA